MVRPSPGKSGNGGDRSLSAAIRLPWLRLIGIVRPPDPHELALKGTVWMLGRKLLAAGTLSLAALTLAACQSDAQQAPAATAAPGLPGKCREEAAEALAGKGRVSDAEAQQATGATIVRQIRPGQGVTMDYRRERVTIETDAKTGKIVRAYCG